MGSQIDIIITHLGTGRWSILNLVVLNYYSIFTSHLIGVIFVAPPLNFSCRVPNTSIDAASSPSVYLEANSSFFIPSNVSTYGGECEYQVNTPDGRKIKEKCSEFEFDHSTFTSTLTSEYNLVCDRAYLRSSFQSLYMFGMFVASPFVGYLSDKYGRKGMTVVGYICYLILAFMSSWVPFLTGILVIRFLMGIFHAVMQYCCIVLGLEILSERMRIIDFFGMVNFWAVSLMLNGGIGYLIRDWKILQTVMALPGLLILPGLWLIDESPRWLVVKGRVQEAIQVVTKVARWQNVDLPPEAELKTLLEEESVKMEDEQSSMWKFLKTTVAEVLVLFRTPCLRRMTLYTYAISFLALMGYYGMSLSGVSLTDDPFLYVVLMGVTEMPVYTFGGFFVNRLGKKPTLSTCFFISSIGLFALGVIPAEHKIIVLIVALVARMVGLGALQIAVLLAGEIFPTEVRNRGMSCLFMVTRIGGMLAPVISNFMGSTYLWISFVIFASSALVGGGFTFLLPETHGQVLSETVADFEEKYKKKTLNVCVDVA